MKKIKEFLKKLILWIISLAILGLVAVGGWQYYQYWQTTHVEEEEIGNSDIKELPIKQQVLVAKAEDITNKQEKINAYWDIIINIIGDAETKNNDNYFIVFDPADKYRNECINNRIKLVRNHNVCYSFGKYQFQLSTFNHYWKKYYKEDLSDKEMINILLNDEEKVKELMKKIILEKGGVFNWSSIKYNEVLTNIMNILIKKVRNLELNK